jgi:hypothetical protein
VQTPIFSATSNQEGAGNLLIASKITASISGVKTRRDMATPQFLVLGYPDYYLTEEGYGH